MKSGENSIRSLLLSLAMRLDMKLANLKRDMDLNTGIKNILKVILCIPGHK